MLKVGSQNRQARDSPGFGAVQLRPTCINGVIDPPECSLLIELRRGPRNERVYLLLLLPLDSLHQTATETANCQLRQRGDVTRRRNVAHEDLSPLAHRNLLFDQRVAITEWDVAGAKDPIKRLLDHPVQRARQLPSCLKSHADERRRALTLNDHMPKGWRDCFIGIAAVGREFRKAQHSLDEELPHRPGLEPLVRGDEKVPRLHAPLIPRLAEKAKERLQQRALARAVPAYEDARLGFEGDLDRLRSEKPLKVRVTRCEAPKIPKPQRFNMHFKLPVLDIWCGRRRERPSECQRKQER